MKNTLLAAAAVLIALAAYLALWPVPIDPVAWDAPIDNGLVDPFGPDEQLTYARGVSLGEYESPEDATLGVDGQIYATTLTGKILKISASGRYKAFTDVGGRPLGIARHPNGSLIVANAYLGLQEVSRNGDVSLLLSEIDGVPLVAANNVAIARNGKIYLSESSTRFGAEASDGSLEASLLDIMEHGGHGRVIEFDPASGATRVLLEDLNYANGVAISDDNDYLLIAETGHYRILRHWLVGPDAGQTEVVIDNLPGFPDNVSNGLQGRFWIGLAAPRSYSLDSLSDKPFLRRVVQRLPAFLRPGAVASSHVIAITGDGQVLMNLQDPAARFPMLTGVLETRDVLYLTSLQGNQLPRLDKRDLL